MNISKNVFDNKTLLFFSDIFDQKIEESSFLKAKVLSDLSK